MNKAPYNPEQVVFDLLLSQGMHTSCESETGRGSGWDGLIPIMSDAAIFPLARLSGFPLSRE